MSTVAPPRPPAPPVHPALVDSEQFIDDHIRRTQRGLKLVDLAAGLLTLAVGLLGFLLAAAVVDHWIIPGGLGPWGRGAMFGLLVLGLGWFAWRQFVPLLRSINPVYAAHTIEKTAPTLKNSLLNVLLFRAHRQGMSAKVFHALEQQAAYRLSSAPADAAIDRAGLLRLGYALVAVVAVAAIYAVLSPKDLTASVSRVVAPWANIAAPSRVQILEVQPGDASVARGERVAISAAVVGTDEDEPVRIRYSTLDEALVGESIVMTRPTGAARFSADLPRGGDAAGLDGVQKDLEYWIEAGDGRSPRYKLTVFTRPTIVVQRVRYKPPTYTGDPPKVVENVGDVFGLEGTEVTVEAEANHPIQTANVDFDADGTNDVKMDIDGKKATAKFTLALREDRRTPWHRVYVLRYTTTMGLANQDPVQHRIDVTPDYLPEVGITRPEEAEVAVRLQDVVPIVVEARDPDFALQNVRLVGTVRGAEALSVELLNERHAGLFRREHRLTPAELKLKAGDVLEYWAEARDNREPAGEAVARSAPRRLRVVDPNDPRAPQNPEGQGGGDPNQGGDSGQGEGQGGDGGADDGQAGGGGESGAAGENDGGQGAAGGQGGEGEQQEGENAQGGGAEGGPGTGSESQNSDASEDGGGGSGGASDGENREGASEASPNQGGKQNPGDQNPGESGDGGSEQGSAGEPSGSEGGGQGRRQERVSSAGEEDAEAFDRIRQRMAQREAEQGGDNSGGDAGAEDQESASGGDAGAEAAGESEGDDSASPAGRNEGEGGDSAGANSNEGESAGAESGAEEGERDLGHGESDGGAADSDASRNGSPNREASASEGANAESDSQGDNGEAPESDGETPAGADGGANPSNGQSSASDDSSGEGGAPEASRTAPRQQAEDDEVSQSGMEGETPTADSRSRTESDATGDQSGDRAGDGQKGGGQQAENAGEGEAGSHTPTDTGANQSSDPGAGATGTEAGDEQLADGETGQSSDDQAGAGSESGDAAGDTAGDGSQTPGGDQPGAGSESNPGGDEATGEAGAQDGEAGADGAGQAGEAGSSSAAGGRSGSADSGASSPASSDPQASDQSSEQGDSSQGDSAGSSAAPPVGGGTQGGGVNGPGATSEPGGDEANLEYARQQTDLVLESLEEQLAKEQVDEELLEDLGWSEQDMRNFVDRWKGLFNAAERDGAASDSQERLDAALRALGPGARGNMQFGGATPTDELRDLNDSYRARAPIEYADRVRAYLRGASAVEDGDD